MTIDGLALGEFGPFRTDTTITTLRNVAVVTIQLPSGWYIDSNVLYGESDGTENNNFTVSGLQAALNGTLPGHVGQFFNPFTDQSLAGPNRAFYGDKQLVASLWQDNRTDIFQYHATAGGTLINLPAGPLSVAGGFEYRSEDLFRMKILTVRLGMSPTSVPAAYLDRDAEFAFRVYAKGEKHNS